MGGVQFKRFRGSRKGPMIFSSPSFASSGGAVPRSTSPADFEIFGVASEPGSSRAYQPPILPLNPGQVCTSRALTDSYRNDATLRQPHPFSECWNFMNLMFQALHIF